MAVSPTLKAVGAAVLAALAFRLTRYEIAEESMAPALEPGDWVVGIRRPARVRIGDVVVFESGPGFHVVKRVAAPPKDAAGLWLLGDNPGAGSVDSRTFGPVSADRIKSRLLLRYQPRPVRAIPPPSES